MLLSALDVTEGSGNLYLTNVAVMGCSCDKGAAAGTGAGTGAGIGAGTGAGIGAGIGAGTGAGIGAGIGAGTGAGTGEAAAAGTVDKFLKIIRLFKILINPRSNVINPFNTSLVDEMYDSTKS